MPYNISNWKTKRLEDLTVPLSTLYNLDLRQQAWQPRRPALISLTGNFFVRISGLGEGWADGSLLSNETFAIKDICVYGEGSGIFYSEILGPALQESTGILEAVLVWEGGDTITQLTVEDGKVVEETIEL